MARKAPGKIRKARRRIRKSAAEWRRTQKRQEEGKQIKPGSWPNDSSDETDSGQ